MILLTRGSPLARIPDPGMEHRPGAPGGGRDPPGGVHPRRPGPDHPPALLRGLRGLREGPGGEAPGGRGGRGGAQPQGRAGGPARGADPGGGAPPGPRGGSSGDPGRTAPGGPLPRLQGGLLQPAAHRPGPPGPGGPGLLLLPGERADPTAKARRRRSGRPDPGGGGGCAAWDWTFPRCDCPSSPPRDRGRWSWRPEPGRCWKAWPARRAIGPPGWRCARNGRCWGAFGKGCSAPVAVQGRHENGILDLRAEILAPDGSETVESRLAGPAGTEEEARALGDRLWEALAGAPPGAPPAGGGHGVTVFLVGAGCGSPRWLCGEARRVLEEADQVVYDRLIHPDALLLAPRGCALYPVGKREGDHLRTQEETNRLLVELGRRGGRVVRLKGGRPLRLRSGGGRRPRPARPPGCPGGRCRGSPPPSGASWRRGSP